MDFNPEIPSGVCLELPLKVQNINRALEAVGGPEEIARVTSEASYSKERAGLELRLRNDAFHHPITSTNLPCNNIVIEITVPKSCLQQSNNNVKNALVSAKRHHHEVRVKPVLHVSSLHRFRGMSDFQYYTGNSSFARKSNASVLNGNLSGIQSLSFNPDLSEEGKRAMLNDVLPPPRFSVNTQPFYYNYKQSAYVKVVDGDHGQQRLINTASTAKVISNIINWGDAVPVEPPAELESTPRSSVRSCIAELQKLFEVRPSYTRRTLQHLLGPVISRQLKFALPYVSYYYRSGPWRGAYIKYGMDPTTSPDLAKYQVEYFRISTTESTDYQASEHLSELADTPENADVGLEDAGKPSSTSSYIFDGSTYPDAPMLQLCDIADGILESYINTTELRSEVNDNDGWYEEKTITLIRKVLRQELIALREEKRPLSMDTKKLIFQEAR